MLLEQKRDFTNGKKPDYIVIFLHGFGADNNDLISLAPIFQKFILDKNIMYLSPNAPFSCEIGFGFQWFSLYDRSEDKMLEGIKAASEILNNYIDAKLEEYNITEDRIIIIGFSQGTMMALYHFLRREKQISMIIGFSGALLGGNLLENEIKSRPKVLLAHGNMDEVVPYAAMKSAEEYLKKNNVVVQTHTSKNLGHSIGEDGILFALNEINKL